MEQKYPPPYPGTAQPMGQPQGMQPQPVYMGQPQVMQPQPMMQPQVMQPVMGQPMQQPGQVTVVQQVYNFIRLYCSQFTS